jgi:chromosomal replication initiator protein
MTIQQTLNPQYTFHAFQQDEGNRLARYFASHLRTPLFLYGGPATGKTHLLHAAGNHLSNRNVKLYAATSTRLGEVDPDGIDALLVDNIQDLPDEQREPFAGEFQQEQHERFANVLWRLRDRGALIMLTSRDEPWYLKTRSKRLKTFLSEMEQEELPQPDAALRPRIIGSVASRIPLSLPENVHEYLAHVKKPHMNYEQLLLELSWYATIQKPLTVALAEESVRRRHSLMPALTIGKLIEEIADYYQTTKWMILHAGKDDAVQRHIAMYLASTLLKAPLPEIGEAFGGFHQTTVLYAVKKIRKTEDPQILYDLKHLASKLGWRGK